MTIDEFVTLSRENKVSDELPGLLKALVLDANNNWNAAHRIAQDDYSSDGSWVHAYLHRKEGDLSNASYWYSNAGRRIPVMSLEEEWRSIAAELLGRIDKLD